MQRSGGCAPVALSDPRASSRTAAAAGAAVETTDPPMPEMRLAHAPAPGRSGRRPREPSPGAPRPCASEGEAASREAGRDLLGARARELLEPLEQRPASESRKLAFWQPKLSPNVASSECSVKIVSAAPIGRAELDFAARRERRDPVGSRVADHDRLASSARRAASGSRTAAAAGRPRAAPKSRPAGRDLDRVAAGRRGREPPVRAIRFVLPGLEPIPSIASSPACSKLSERSSCLSVIQYRPPRSR